MRMKTATVNQIPLYKSLWNSNECEGIVARSKDVLFTTYQ